MEFSMSSAENKPIEMSDVLSQLVTNQIFSRSEWLNTYYDSRRDIDKECGYSDSTTIDAKAYRVFFDTHEIANRVASVLPNECWKKQPTVYEDEDPSIETPFEQDWREIAYRLGGEESLYRGEEGNPVWELLQRADVMSGVGTFGIIVLGIDDGKDLSEPATFNPKKPVKLLYARVFDESLVQVSRSESDPTNPRYGQPVTYSVTLGDPEVQSNTNLGYTNTTRDIHWSRVVHLADNIASNEWFGIPRMRPVWKRLLDLRKLFGGSAEMYWRGAFPGFAFQVDPRLAANLTLDKDSLRSEMDNYMNGLQRYIATMGTSVKSLAPQVVDPTPQIDVHIKGICIQLEVPLRVFEGSERGELASTQDSSTWEDRLQARRSRYVTPRVIVPFVNRLMSLGVLRKPKQYYVAWTSEEMNLSKRADIASKLTDAIVKYVGGQCWTFMSPLDFLSKVLPYDEAEAEVMMKNTKRDANLIDIPEPVAPKESLGTKSTLKVGVKPPNTDTTTGAM